MKPHETAKHLSVSLSLCLALSTHSYANTSLVDALSLCDSVAESSLEAIDLSAASVACEAAAKQYPDNLKIRYALGLIYFEMQEYGAATVWLNKAAAYDYTKAQYALGYMYEHGYARNASLDTAVVWYGRAAELGNEDAAKRLDEIKASGFKLGKLFQKYDISENYSEIISSKNSTGPLISDQILEKAASYLLTATINALMNPNNPIYAPPTAEETIKKLQEDRDALRQSDDNFMNWVSVIR